MLNPTWTPEKLETLKEMLAGRYSYKRIAQRLGVSLGSVRAKACRLGLSIRGPRIHLDRDTRLKLANKKFLELLRQHHPELEIRPIEAIPVIQSKPVSAPVAINRTPTIEPLDDADPTWVIDVQRAVCEFYDISLGDLRSHRRYMPLSLHRQVAMYLAKEATFRSFPDIARRFNGRDHTTVMHAVRKIWGILPGDPKLQDDLKKLTALVRKQTAKRLEARDATEQGGLGISAQG